LPPSDSSNGAATATDPSLADQAGATDGDTASAADSQQQEALDDSEETKKKCCVVM